MSLSNHGKDGSEITRFMQQQMGIADREFPNGRIGAEDDGSLSYAIATDVKHRCILLKFAKPTDWVGLDVKSAEQLRDQLTERLLELKCGSVTGR